MEDFFEVYKYRIWCETDQQWEFVWADEDQPEPTTCPVDTGHTINPALTTVVDTIGRVQEVSEDGAGIVELKNSITKIGMHAVQVLNLPDLSSDLIKSFQLTAAPQTTEILDIFIGEDLVGPTGKCYLAGGEYRCRTSAEEGSALHFEIVDRNDVLGLFPLFGMSRTRLTGLSAFSGGTIDDINAGEYAVGNTSGSRTRILGKGADFLEVQFHEAEFADGETITITDAQGTPTGVSCDITEWDEGDVILVLTSVKDEWIEGMDMRDIQPGGSKEVPEGMYFRVKCFNNDTTEDLRIKISLTVGRL